MIIDLFTHNLDLISQARKNFRPQSTNDNTVVAEQSDYVWDPEWSHPAFINIPKDISSNFFLIWFELHLKGLKFDKSINTIQWLFVVPDFALGKQKEKI